jgi:hypothetical protein
MHLCRTGEIFQQMGLPDEALAVYSAALQHDPWQSHIYMARARIYRDQRLIVRRCSISYSSLDGLESALTVTAQRATGRNSRPAWYLRLGWRSRRR